MSSKSSTTPDHRVVFDGMNLALYAPGSPVPVARADLDAPDMARQVANLAAEAEASRGLTVVLPEAEVWRGELRLKSRTPWGRQAEALAEAEIATGIGRDALDIAKGLRTAGFSEPDVADLMGGNWVRFFRDNFGARETALQKVAE